MSDTLTLRAVGRLFVGAGLLGALGAVAGLVFLGVTAVGGDWYGDTGAGWFDGHWWWIAVAAGAGAVVGVLRRVLSVPAETPGIIEDLETERIDPAGVPGIVAVSAVSLVGGASIGPEVALGQMGGGAGAVLADRVGADEDEKKELALSGMGGAFAGLFSSPVLSTALALEIARPPNRRYGASFYGTAVASSVSLAIYFALAGTVLLGVYEVPSYTYEDWHLLAGFGLGLLSVVVTLLTAVVVVAVKRLVEALRVPDLLLPVLGGTAFGLIGVALPLVNFTGTDQLATVLDDAGTLGIGLLLATLAAKMLAFGISRASGFIGGPIFPILFLGGTAGVLVNEIVPGIPLGLAFSCMLAAVPGAAVKAPFTLVLLAALLTQIGVIQTGPVLIAVATAYLATMLLKPRIEASVAGHGPRQPGS